MFNIIICLLIIISLGAVLFVLFKTHKLKKKIEKKSNHNLEIVNKIIEQSHSKKNNGNEHLEIDNIDNIDKLRTNTEYAIECFTPILERLRNNFGQPIFLSDFLQLSKFGNWVLFSVLSELEYKEMLSTLVYRNNRFIFYIIINNKLFKNDKLTSMGRIAITHGFCHFVSIFISIAGIRSEELARKIGGKLTRSLYVLRHEELTELYKLLSNNESTIIENNDNHFRLGYENVQFDYSDLFKGLLLPVSEIKEVFNDEKQRQFISFYKENKTAQAMSLFSDSIEILINKTDLPREFVISRCLLIYIQLLCEVK